MTYLLSKKSLKPATVKRKVKTIKSLLKHGCDLADADNGARYVCEVGKTLKECEELISSGFECVTEFEGV